MPEFVKKIGNQEYYEIDGIRAAGIIPFYIENNQVKLLINTEYRKTGLFYNVLGGKVDRFDDKIEDTMMREFNEETGFLVSDIIRDYYNNKNLSKHNIFFDKSKYMLSLLNISNSKTWELLPYNYKEIFKNIESFHDRESEDLLWIDLFTFKGDTTYLLSIILNKLKNYHLFKKYNIDDEPLFVD
jgi:8-oxo-dGTP pyrophosphatase MutT (NUDIX family)